MWAWIGGVGLAAACIIALGAWIWIRRRKMRLPPPRKEHLIVFVVGAVYFTIQGTFTAACR